MSDPTESSCPSRRLVISAGVGVTLTGCAALLTGCGGDDGKGAAPADPTSDAPTTSASMGAGMSEPPPAVKEAIDAKKVPVGGAIVLAEHGILAQPTEGKYTLYSSACTHKQVQLTTVSGSRTTCPAHGSVFDVTTGAVVKGPAETPLSKMWESA